ncbi:MAG: hypothetical protein ABI026_00405 [Gemmatimonadaceae bacterium]
MSKSLTADVPQPAHAKAIKALDEFDSLVSQYEMLLDTQQVMVRTANFSALFEMASRGDKLARDAVLCGQRFSPLVDAIASGQFTGPRATEIKKRSFSSQSNAETLTGASAQLAARCISARDIMGREIRQTHASAAPATGPSAYWPASAPFLDRRG